MMWLKRTNWKGGFTFIELMIVITIISLLAVIAISNYGLATQKARLQISVESLVALFDQAKVSAQSDGSHCFGVWIGDGSPELWTMDWDGEALSCVYKEPVVTTPLQWSSKIGFQSIQWQAISSTNTLQVQDKLEQLLMVFEPPNGILDLYDAESEKSLTDQGAYQVCAEFIYDHSVNPIMKKAINVVLITSSFDILGACNL